MRINSLEYFEFPFDLVPRGKNIIIYGAGTVGQQYIIQVLREGKYNLKHVVDKRCCLLNDLDIGFEVTSPDILDEISTKEIFVVIANKNRNESVFIQQDLVHRGIKEEQIIYDLRKRIMEVPEFSMKKTYNSCYSAIQVNRQGEDELRILKKLNKILEIEKPVGMNLVRLGGNNDGGYILVDSFNGNSKIVYSFGIGSEVSFDRHLAQYGYDVYQYDHTIDELPEQNEKFHYFHRGIADSLEYNELFDSLENFLKINCHEDKEQMILKMDVEGAEYGVIEHTSSSIFKKFNQMVFEFHVWPNKGLEKKLYDAIGKLKETHSIVHIHANNYGGVRWIDGVPYADAYEITLANRDCYSFEKNPELELPILLDAPCNPNDKEIVLGKWNQR